MTRVHPGSVATIRGATTAEGHYRTTGDGTDDFRQRSIDALRAEGYRMTQQRAILLDLIGRTEVHLNAVDLYTLARAVDQRISLSTIYRTLAVLKRHELVTEVHLSEDHHHYEPRRGDAHYHLVCQQCGSVEEFGAMVVDVMRESLRAQYGFVIHAVELDVSGTCRSCVA